MAAAPLTVTTDRERAVHFLDPAFMTFDLALLMRKVDSEAHPDVRTLADLNSYDETGFTAGAVAGGATVYFLQRSRYSGRSWQPVLCPATGAGTCL